MKASRLYDEINPSMMVHKNLDGTVCKLLTVGMLLFAACRNGSQGPTANTADPGKAGSVHATADPVVGFAEAAPFVLAGCYEMTMQRDTATLNLQVTDTVVTGTLVYRWYARDGNTGTIKGVLRDSLVVADYTFRSEGLTSVREVIFKIQDTTLVQAFGDLANRGNKIVYANRDAVQYTTDHPFVKVPCAGSAGQ